MEAEGLAKMLPVVVDTALLSILRMLVATGDVKYVADDKFASTTFSTAIATVTGVKAAIIRAVDMNTTALHLLVYLKKMGYQESTDTKHGNHYSAFGKDVVTRLKEYPGKREQFDDFMAATSVINPTNRWWTKYFYERLLDGYEVSSSPLVVNVGRGTGTAPAKFRDVLPQPYGSSASLVLQDLQSVIDQAKSRSLPPNIQVMAHHFFEPQPVNAARAYFMRAILHDWPDTECQNILGNLHAAMKPGYSKLLLDEGVVSSKSVDALIAACDITMMIKLDAKERTSDGWKALLERSGFWPVKSWENGRFVLEAEVK
jgi:hypothetical protein